LRESGSWFPLFLLAATLTLTACPDDGGAQRGRASGPEGGRAAVARPELLFLSGGKLRVLSADGGVRTLSERGEAVAPVSD